MTTTAPAPSAPAATSALAPLAPAAFCRVERNLCPESTAAAIRWLAINAQSIRARLRGLGELALLRSFSLAGRYMPDEVDAERLRWTALRGMSMDRLALLGQEYAERFFIPHLRPITLDLLHAARERGCRLVLVSDNVEEFVKPLADHLGADLICNRAQIDTRAKFKGSFTGTLEPPIFSGRMSGQWLRAYAATKRIDLQTSCAFGAQADDSFLLSLVGQPCAVGPDRALRQTAHQLAWPVVEP
jgi:phosphoserine phosphatase